MLDTAHSEHGGDQPVSQHDVHASSDDVHASVLQHFPVGLCTERVALVNAAPTKKQADSLLLYKPEKSQQGRIQRERKQTQHNPTMIGMAQRHHHEHVLYSFIVHISCMVGSSQVPAVACFRLVSKSCLLAGVGLATWAVLRDACTDTPAQPELHQFLLGGLVCSVHSRKRHERGTPGCCFEGLWAVADGDGNGKRGELLQTCQTCI